MTPTENIAAGFDAPRVTTRDERVASAYRPTAMSDAIEDLAKRDPDKLTPAMKMQLGYVEEARAAAERVERGEAK